MRPLRVLVVDDVSSMRFMCKRFFLRCGLDVEVAEAASGEEALALLEAKPFDCILSDHRMGAVTGLDVLAFALEHQPAAIRCMMTGFADPALAEEASRRAKVHVFIEKPMEMGDLWALLQSDLVERHLRPLVANLPASG